VWPRTHDDARSPVTRGAGAGGMRNSQPAGIPAPPADPLTPNPLERLDFDALTPPESLAAGPSPPATPTWPCVSTETPTSTSPTFNETPTEKRPLGSARLMWSPATNGYLLAWDRRCIGWRGARCSRTPATLPLGSLAPHGVPRPPTHPRDAFLPANTDLLPLARRVPYCAALLPCEPKPRQDNGPAGE